MTVSPCTGKGTTSRKLCVRACELFAFLKLDSGRASPADPERLSRAIKQYFVLFGEKISLCVYRSIKIPGFGMHPFASGGNILAFACSSGYGFVVEDARGKEVKPVRWHCSTTSLKTTSHGPFFPPMLCSPGCRMLLNCQKEVLPFAFSLRADGGAVFCLPGCA